MAAITCAVEDTGRYLRHLVNGRTRAQVAIKTERILTESLFDYMLHITVEQCATNCDILNRNVYLCEH